jgi:hypothetical protein
MAQRKIIEEVVAWNYAMAIAKKIGFPINERFFTIMAKCLNTYLSEGVFQQPLIKEFGGNLNDP